MVVGGPQAGRHLPVQNVGPPSQFFLNSLNVWFTLMSNISRAFIICQFSVQLLGLLLYNQKKNIHPSLNVCSTLIVQSLVIVHLTLNVRPILNV